MSRTPSDINDVFGAPAVESAPEAPVYLSRREAREARAAQQATVAAPTSGALAVSPAEIPHIPAAPAAVLRSSGIRSAPPTGAGHDRPHRALPAKRARHNPLRVLASMAVIGGLFAVAGLPAYGESSIMTEEASAATESSPASAASTVSAQSITVSADLTLPKLERDQFEATSPEDLEIIRQLSAIASENAQYAASGARELGDDYPWATAGYELSPLNYYLRQCTDFVAWRLNRDVGSFSAPFRWAWADLTPNGGDASQWKSAWEDHGWTISATPVVGSVAWFGSINHVAYVKSVNTDGSVLIEEYNYVNRVYGQRILAAADVEAFLYPPGQ